MRQFEPSVYLIDASIYIFRGWFVLPETITDRDGKPCNAVLGFVDFLLQLIEEKQPTHIACAFDTAQSASTRKAIYPEYKADRPETPEMLKHQFVVCRQWVAALGLAGFDSEHHEADDILGTFALHARDRNIPFVVVTADKDLTQLIGKKDFWWSFAKDYWLDYRGVERRFGVRPHQIADLLALAGDKVDNIPGVPGVGVTTAARLLTKWGNIDSLYDNLERVGEMKFRGAKRIQSLLSQHRNAVEIARQLTPVLPDPSLPSNFDCLRPKPIDKVEFDHLAERLNLGKRRRTRWEKALENLHGQKISATIE